MNNNNISDEDLVALVQKGDESAFAMIMDRYTGKLLRYGTRLLPREINIGDTVQDVFVTVYKNIKSFDAGKKFSPWIYRIAHNAFIDVVRKKAKGPMYVFDFDTIIPHPIYEDPAPKEKENEEMSVLLKKGLDNLPPAYKEIIGLYYFDDLSYKDIADILHIPLGTVGIRLTRAKNMLKKMFPEKRQ